MTIYIYTGKITRVRNIPFYIRMLKGGKIMKRLESVKQMLECGLVAVIRPE